MKITWSPLAIKRIEDISDFIAFDKPAAALKWVNDIFDKIDLLVTTPEYGRVVPEIGIKSIREIVFGNYRVIYQISDNVIFILTVRNYKQRLNNLEHIANP